MYNPAYFTRNIFRSFESSILVLWIRLSMSTEDYIWFPEEAFDLRRTQMYFRKSALNNIIFLKDAYCIASLRIISTSPATPPWTILTPVCACWALLDWAICLSVHQSVSVSELHSQSLILWAVRASQSPLRVDFPLKVMKTQCFSAWLMA